MDSVAGGVPLSVGEIRACTSRVAGLPGGSLIDVRKVRSPALIVTRPTAVSEPLEIWRFGGRALRPLVGAARRGRELAGYPQEIASRRRRGAKPDTRVRADRREGFHGGRDRRRGVHSRSRRGLSRACHFLRAGGTVPAAGADGHARLLHSNLQRSIPAICFRVRRVVAEKIVGREVVGDLAEALVQVVGVHHGDAVRSVRQIPQRQRMGPSQLRVGGQRQRGSPACFESDQTARVDRIERRVAAVGLSDDVAQELLVVDRGEALPVRVALHLGDWEVVVLVEGILGRQRPARSDANRINRGSLRAATPILEPELRREEIPSVRHSENRFSLLFDPADVPDEILKRLENFSLPLARDQSGRQIPIRARPDSTSRTRPRARRSCERSDRPNASVSSTALR